MMVFEALLGAIPVYAFIFSISKDKIRPCHARKLKILVHYNILTFCSRTTTSFLSFVIIMLFLLIMSSRSEILCYQGSEWKPHFD